MRATHQGPAPAVARRAAAATWGNPVPPRAEWPRMRLVPWKALVKGTLRGFANVELLPIELKLLLRWGWRRVC
jgi:hypothetical protein